MSSLRKTSAAVKKIKSANLRRDFARMVEAANAGLKAKNHRHAGQCLRTVAAMAFGLHETITDDVALAILQGVASDAAGVGISGRAINMQPQQNKSYDDGGGVGRGRCRRDPGGVCLHLSGGCGGTIYERASVLERARSRPRRISFRMHEP